MKNRAENNLLTELCTAFEIPNPEKVEEHLQEDPRYSYLVQEYDRIRANCSTQVSNNGGEVSDYSSVREEESDEQKDGREFYLQGFCDGLSFSKIVKEYHQIILEYLPHTK